MGEGGNTSLFVMAGKIFLPRGNGTVGPIKLSSAAQDPVECCVCFICIANSTSLAC